MVSILILHAFFLEFKSLFIFYNENLSQMYKGVLGVIYLKKKKAKKLKDKSSN